MFTIVSDENTCVNDVVTAVFRFRSIASTYLHDTFFYHLHGLRKIYGFIVEFGLFLFFEHKQKFH